MTGKQYADLIAAYLLANFGDRGIEVYREVPIGKSIIGKNRKVDIMVVLGAQSLAIECKYQQMQGTTDEKIPYALEDVQAMWTPAVLSYAGGGWSVGVLHMLQGSVHGVACSPNSDDLARTPATLELDHIVASVFGWWDIVTVKKRRFDLDAWRAAHDEAEEG